MNAVANLPNVEGLVKASWAAEPPISAAQQSQSSNAAALRKLEAELRQASKGIEDELHRR